MKQRSLQVAWSKVAPELNSTQLASIGSFWALRPVATLLQISLGRGTLKWVRLREIRHKIDISERPETLATSSMQRALATSAAGCKH